MALAVLNELVPGGWFRWLSAAAEPLSTAPLSTTTERVFLPGVVIHTHAADWASLGGG